VGVEHAQQNENEPPATTEEAANPSRPPETTSATGPGADKPPLSPAEIETLIRRGNQGDPKAVSRLRVLAEEGQGERWRELGDLAAMTARMMSKHLFGPHLASARSAEDAVERRRRDLYAQYPSALEQMMVDRVMITMQFAYSVDLAIVAAGTNGTGSEKLVRTQALAESRVQTALKSLQLAHELASG
jgi:hypothetical protein